MDNEEAFKEFMDVLCKRGSKPHKLTHCFGARDAWKWVRSNKWKAVGEAPVDQSLYSTIINEVNRCLIELLLEGHQVELPYQMGILILSSLPARVALEDGEWNTNYRTDWVKTTRLWFEDKEAMDTHKPIKRVSQRIYYIRYSKKGARYAHKKYYRFRVNRSLAKRLGKEIATRKMITECLY